MSPTVGVLAIDRWSSLRDRWRSAPSGCGSRGPPATSTSPPARSRRGERLGDRRRVPLGGVVPRRSPGWCSPMAAHMLWYPVGWTAGYLVLLVLVAAPLRRSGAYTLPDFAAPAAGVASGAPGGQRAGRPDRRALPDAAVPGRRDHAARLDRRAALGRRRWSWLRSCWSTWSSGGMRSDHARPGVPVLAQADRHPAARGGAARRLARRRHPRHEPAAERQLGRAAVRRPRPLLDVLADPGDVPRHDGPAARAWCASTPTGRPGGPPHHGGRAACCSAASTCSPRCTACSAASTRRGSSPPTAPTPSCSSCPSACCRARPPTCSPALLGAGAFAAFLSTSSGLVVSIAGVVEPGPASAGGTACGRSGSRARSGCWSRSA